MATTLESIMESIADKLTRHLPRSARSEVLADLMQTMHLAALEAERTYRGDNGAQFSSYAYFAMVCQARLALKNYQSPVSSAKNDPKGWVKRAAPAAGAESIETTTPDLDAKLDADAVAKQLRWLARRHPLAQVIEAVVFAEEDYDSVSARTGLPVPQLRRAVGEYRVDVAQDPTLRALHASR